MKTAKLKRYGNPRFHELLDEIGQLHSDKNYDYAAGGKQGSLGNFKRISQIMRMYPACDWTSPKGVALIYMLKQLDACMMQHTTGNKTKTGEPITSRLRDMAIYDLIAIVLDEEEQRAS